MKPDTLGESLDKLLKALPQVQTLRLCHRYGRGPQVHITKLPIEVEQAIEGLLIRSQKSGDIDGWTPLTDTWRQQLECFESKCEPMTHLYEADANSPISDEAGDDHEPCYACEEDPYGGSCENRCKKNDKKRCDECNSGSTKKDPHLCENSCYSKKQVIKNEIAIEAWGSEKDHQATANRWLRRIDQSKDGGFVGLAKVCSSDSWL